MRMATIELSLFALPNFCRLHNRGCVFVGQAPRAQMLRIAIKRDYERERQTINPISDKRAQHGRHKVDKILEVAHVHISGHAQSRHYKIKVDTLHRVIEHFF